MARPLVRTPQQDDQLTQALRDYDRAAIALYKAERAIADDLGVEISRIERPVLCERQQINGTPIFVPWKPFYDV